MRLNLILYIIALKVCWQLDLTIGGWFNNYI